MTKMQIERNDRETTVVEAMLKVPCAGELLGDVYYEISEYQSELRRTYDEREEDLDAYGYDETNCTLLGEDLYAAEMIAELRQEAQKLKSRMKTVKIYIN